MSDLLLAKRLGLTRSEARILIKLWEAPNRCLAKGDIHVSAECVKVHMCHLRNKLLPHSIIIDTIWGRGYAISDSSVPLIEAVLA